MPRPRTYQVRPGDTLSGIALRQGVPLALLVRLNGIPDANRIYVGQVLELNAPPGVPLPPAPVVAAPAVHQPLEGPARAAPRSMTVEDFLSPSRGSHAPAAIIIGCAEGNRTPHGGFVWSSFGHKDPGNGMRNLGSFSSQMTPERELVILGKDAQPRKARQLVLSHADKALSTQEGKHQIQRRLDGRPFKEQRPEVTAVDLESMYELIGKADQLQLEAMRARITAYTSAARSAGLDPNHPLLLATYFDSFNQSEAAGSRLLKQFPFIKAQKQGITQETMVDARCRSWLDPSTQRLYTHLDKKSHKLKEYGSNFRKIQSRHNAKSKDFLSLSQVIRADQSRRIAEMVKALAHLETSGSLQPTRSPSAKPTSAKPTSAKPTPTKPIPASAPKGDADRSGLSSALPPRLTEVAEGKRVLIPGSQDGSKDAVVSELQRLLAFALPLWSEKLGAERGRFGPSTRDAVLELQRVHKLPSATGGLNAATLELLKFEVYSRYFQQRGAALDTRVNVKTLLGLRIPTSTHANNNRGTYDDRFVMLWREGTGSRRVREFRGNTDPAGEYLARGYGFDVDRKNGKELGRLKEGYYVYQQSVGYTGWLKGKHVLRSKGSLPVEYDVNHDGQFDKRDAVAGKESKTADILIHVGSRETTGSAGCMTLPPDEFQRLWSLLGTQKDIKYLLVTLDGDPGTPPPAAPKKNAPAVAGPTAERMVQFALAQANKKYVYGTEVRLDDPSPKAFDCSELIQWAVHQAGGRITDGSQEQRKSCHAHRTNISVAQALKTRGALLFTSSHVAISLGDGTTIEAANSRSGVKSLTAYGRGWTDAGLVPGLHYGGAAPKSAPKPAAPPARTASAPPAPVSGNLTLGHGVRINTEHPSLKKLATAKLHDGEKYMCTKTTRGNMTRLGIPGAPGPTGDDNNNPRGAMVQMFRHGWTSIPFPGAKQEHIRSHYGNVTADVITAAQYNTFALNGQVPDGAIIFQTRHGWDYGVKSSGSDMGVVRNRGRTTHNYEEMPSAIVYRDCKSVVIMVPREALQSTGSDKAVAAAPVPPPSQTPKAVAVSTAGPASTAGTAGVPSWNFDAAHFPGYYDASRDSDKVYNVKHILADVPQMWKDYGSLFKQVGRELQADPYALAAYCVFESYRSGSGKQHGSYNARMLDRSGTMVAAGIAATQAQDVKGKRIPGLKVSFPPTVDATQEVLRDHPEYAIRCLAAEFKAVYQGRKAHQDLARAFPLVAYPAWGSPQRKRGSYGTQPVYVSRAYCFYKAFREADRAARA